ncbi:MAG: carbohydrate kinase family protein [Caldilineaceae bacterium]
MIEVYCSGNLVADVQTKTLTQFLPVDQVAIVDEIELILGGNAANAAICLARMGVQAGVIGRIGDDFFGQFVRNVLAEAGVDTQMLMAQTGAKTAATVAAIDEQGRRRCAHTPGVTSQFTAQDFDWRAIASNGRHTPNGQSPFLHFSSFFLLPGFDGPAAAQVLQRARAAGLRTSLDVCWDPSGQWAAALLPILPHCDIIFPNQAEARAITQRDAPVDMADWFLANGVQTAVIKLGPDGCLVKQQGGQPVRINGYAAPVVDATGAGDAFAGGFLAAQVWGWDVEACARFACALAALSVTDFGAARAIQSKEQVLNFMKSGSRE